LRLRRWQAWLGGHGRDLRQRKKGTRPAGSNTRSRISSELRRRTWAKDLYTPVISDYAKGNNKFTGKIDKVTIDLKKMSPADEATAEKAAGVSDEVDADTD
jgi:hypothetical protein